MSLNAPLVSAEDRARFIRDRLPPHGLFAGMNWRISPKPFLLGPELAQELETLGRVLLQFYRAANLLYRRSVEGKQPAWVAGLLDQGKPEDLLALQRAPAFKSDLPRVIRPDILLTEQGFSITELDSVPGGIGLTGWLNQAYAAAGGRIPPNDLRRFDLMNQGAPLSPRGAGGEGGDTPGADGFMGSQVLGGASGMIEGFSSIFGDAARVHLVVSEEAATYRPEMEWMAAQLGSPRFEVRDARFTDFQPGDAVYRFFELFDLANVPNAKTIFEAALEKRLRLTPPPKPLFEEKLLLALLWNRNLREFWRRELGEGFLARILKLVPYSWVVDPAPLPPHAAIPELNLTDWQQLKVLSQRERELVLKVSGYSPEAWGARGVYLGSDLSTADWSMAVDKALAGFGRSPYLLQRYHKPKIVEASYFDFEARRMVAMPGRVRLCPYYFVSGEGDAARAKLGGVLATICPADKKIIHGMQDAILAPCVP